MQTVCVVLNAAPVHVSCSMPACLGSILEAPSVGCDVVERGLEGAIEDASKDDKAAQGDKSFLFLMVERGTLIRVCDPIVGLERGDLGTDLRQGPPSPESHLAHWCAEEGDLAVDVANWE